MLHDLGGPLNAMSILCEVMRGRLAHLEDPPTEQLARISDSVQNFARMLAQVRRCADSMSNEPPAPCDLAAALADAADRAEGVATLAVACAPGLQVLVPPAAFAAMLDAGYRCLRAAGAIRWEVVDGDGDDGHVGLRVLHCGDGPVFPGAMARAHLVAGADADAGWLEWTCRVEGIGGTFVPDATGDDRAIVLALPRVAAR